MDKKKTWMYIAIGAIILSVVSLFLPVITYQNSNGNVYSFNIVKVIAKGSDFIDYVLMDNDGSFAAKVNSPALSSLLAMSSDNALPKVLIALVAIIGIAAIVASFLGIRNMSKQYESAWPFRLTILGLVLTAIPALAILILTLISKDYFSNTIKLGAYVFVTPIAMIVAIITVNNRHKISQEQKRIQEEAKKYLHPAGDLID